MPAQQVRPAVPQALPRQCHRYTRLFFFFGFICACAAARLFQSGLAVVDDLCFALAASGVLGREAAIGMAALGF